MATAPGPYLAPHLLVKWGGTLPGNEEWSCQLRMGRVGAGPWPDISPETHATVQGIELAIIQYHVKPLAHISPRVLLKTIKVNMIGVDGKYALPRTNVFTGGGTAAAGTGTVYYPNQVAICVTLRTAFDRGVGHSGKVFLPMPNTVVATDGLIATVDAADTATTFKALITQLNAVDPKYAVSVFSRKLGGPTQLPVLGVKVGRVLDTQRRRRNHLPETYYATP